MYEVVSRQKRYRDKQRLKASYELDMDVDVNTTLSENVNEENADAIDMDNNLDIEECTDSIDEDDNFDTVYENFDEEIMDDVYNDGMYTWDDLAERNPVCDDDDIYFDADDADDEIQNITTTDELRAELQKWCILSGVTVSSTTALLEILRKIPQFSDLPKSGKTLRNINMKIQGITNTNEGIMYYFGIRKQLGYFMVKHPELQTQDVWELELNFDGLPLYRSSKG